MPTSLVSIDKKPPLEYAYFPSRCMGAIFRVWGYIAPEKLAKVLGTSVDNVKKSAEKMGLDPDIKVDPMWRERGYITIIKNLWQMLSYDQICTLLDLTSEEFDLMLKEEDFLFVKLGMISPECEDTLWRELTPEEEKHAEWIKKIVEKNEKDLSAYKENAFDFVKKYYEEDNLPPVVADINGDLRLVYSYFTLFGDILMDDNADPFPDKLLREYAEHGINGIWLQAVLYQLVYFPFAPELSKGYENRRKNLQRIVDKAARYGIGIYFYMNEPRSMNEAVFEKYPHIKGHTRNPANKLYSLCTSTPEVQEYLEGAMYTLFSEVKGLGGIVTISASENQTHCYSHSKEDTCTCERCKKRKAGEVIAEVNNIMARGVKRGNPKARVVVWDWSWPKEQTPDIIRALDKDIILQKTSENDMEIIKGGIKNRVSDYTMSNPGPGPLAKEVWAVARESGLECSAKVQFNCTWEMSGVPYIPAFDLVAEHAENLKKENIKHIMMSWTLGGSASPNIQLVNDIILRGKTLEEFLQSFYTAEEWETVNRAQHELSEGFREFPFHVFTAYNAPQNAGPRSPFFPEKTGWSSTMVGFPYDSINSWRANYPEDIFENQFRLVCEGNRRALDIMESYTGERSDRFEDTFNCMKGCMAHFLTSYNLIRFVRHRNKAPTPTAEDIKYYNEIFDSEEKNVRDAVKLLSEFSKFGFEATNHYAATRRDLIEKLINIEYMREYYEKRR